jgi:hypothetical protein
MNMASTKIVSPRIGAREAHEEVQAGRAIFVCGYDDEEKCRRLHLEGAISFNEFVGRLPSVSRDQEVIFYCA